MELTRLTSLTPGPDLGVCETGSLHTHRAGSQLAGQPTSRVCSASSIRLQVVCPIRTRSVNSVPLSETDRVVATLRAHLIARCALLDLWTLYRIQVSGIITLHLC